MNIVYNGFQHIWHYYFILLSQSDLGDVGGKYIEGVGELELLELKKKSYPFVLEEDFRDMLCKVYNIERSWTENVAVLEVKDLLILVNSEPHLKVISKKELENHHISKDLIEDMFISLFRYKH